MFEYLIPSFLQLPELLHWSQLNHKTNKTSQLFVFKLVKVNDWNDFFKKNGPYAHVHYCLTNNKKHLWHIAEWAAYYGDLNCIQQMNQNFSVEPEEWAWAFNNACLKGRLDIVQFLHENVGLELTERCWISLEHNHINVAEYLHLKNCKFDGNSIAQTACYGNTRSLQWLRKHRPNDLLKHSTDVSRGIDFCASTSNQKLIEILHSWGFRGNNPIKIATTYQQPEKFIKWLRSQGYET
jgi:hypothetical protein